MGDLRLNLRLNLHLNSGTPLSKRLIWKSISDDPRYFN